MTISVYCLAEEKTIAWMDGNVMYDLSAAMVNDTWRPVSQGYKMGYVEPEDVILCPRCGGPLTFHEG